MASLHQGQVGAALAQQGLVRALLDHAAVLEHQHAVVAAMSTSSWAITISVRPRCTRATASWIRRADTASTEAVGSSITRIAGALTSARARHRRWRWPPESVAARSPSSVS